MTVSFLNSNKTKLNNHAKSVLSGVDDAAILVVIMLCMERVFFVHFLPCDPLSY